MKAKIKAIQRMVRKMKNRAEIDALMTRWADAFDREDWDEWGDLMPLVRDMNLNCSNRRK